MTDYYIAPDGDDGGAGTEGDPWLTLVDKINAEASAGDTFWCRGGLYLGQGNKTLTVNGSEGAPITIRAYPGETPVFSGALPEITWVVHDAGLNIWRSTGTYSSGDINFRAGARMYHGGKDFNLVAYGPTQWDYFSSELHTMGSTTDGPFYGGPGVLWDRDNDQSEGAVIYIRLEKRDPTALYDVDHPHFATDYNPNNHTIRVFPAYSMLRFPAEGDAWYDVIDMTFTDCDTVFSNAQTHCNFRGIRAFYVRSAHGTQEPEHHILIERGFYRGDVPRSLSFNDLKGGVTPFGWHQQGFAGLSEVHDLTVRNCHIFEGLDAFVITGGVEPYNISIVHNKFGTPSGAVKEFCGIDDGVIWDDTIQLSNEARNVEFAYNEVCGVGISHHGVGGDSSDPGKVWIHHNYFENLTKVLRTEVDPSDLIESGAADNHGWQFTNIFASHAGGGLGTGAPWKTYNNTFQYGPPYSNPPNNSKTGFAPVPSPNGATELHQVMNNIIAQVAETATVAIMPGAIQPRYYIGEAWDGNAWWLDPAIGTRSTSGFEYLYRVWVTSMLEVNYATLAAMKADTTRWDDSQANYAPGFENSGIDDVDPEIEAGTWAALGEGIHTGAVDLSSTGWPGVDDAYRGAVNPSGGEQIGIESQGRLLLSAGRVLLTAGGVAVG